MEWRTTLATLPSCAVLAADPEYTCRRRSVLSASVQAVGFQRVFRALHPNRRALLPWNAGAAAMTMAHCPARMRCRMMILSVLIAHAFGHTGCHTMGADGDCNGEAAKVGKDGHRLDAGPADLAPHKTPGLAALDTTRPALTSGIQRPAVQPSSLPVPPLGANQSSAG